MQPDGRRVRCARCQTVWLAEPNHADKLFAAAYARGPAPAIAASVNAGAEEVETGGEEFSAVPAQASWEESTLRQAEDGNSFVRPLESPSDLEPAAAEDVGETVATVDAPPIAPVDLDEGQPPVEIEAEDTGAGEDIETYAARRGKRAGRFPALRWPLSRLQSGVLALLIVDALLVGWRDEFVRIMPQTASFYSMLGLNVNLRGMTFADVGTSVEQSEGTPVLVVDGNIVNDSGKLESVPRLKLVVRNGSRQEVYSWTIAPPRQTLAPGEAIAFHSRLTSPPVEAHDVLVRFVTRRDILAGAH